MTLIVGAEHSHLVPGQDIHHLGREVVVVVGEEGLVADLVEEVVEASGVEEDHADLVVEEGRDLHLQVVLPLCHQIDCLDRVQYPGVAKQHSDLHHQYLMGVGLLLELRVRGVGVGFLHRTCATEISKRSRFGEKKPYFAFNAKCVCSIAYTFSRTICISWI
jgi:hypothetical protein